MRKLGLSIMAAGLLLDLSCNVANAGFFESLFGGAEPAPAQAPAPSYEEPAQNTQMTRRQPRHVQLLKAHPARASIVGSPKEDHDAIKEASKNTNIMQDRTLRPGDAVMTASGLRIFEGSKAANHNVAEFVKVSEAQNVSRDLRPTLVAIDAPRSPISWQASDVDASLVTGRSSSAGAAVKYTALDRDGRSIRVVGQ